MKIAHICPPAFLSQLILNDHKYHLLLPQVWVTNKVYKTFYLDRIQRGDHVIMDNGAYENQGHVHPSFHEALHDLQPFMDQVEIVAPDDMTGSAGVNLSLLKAFLDTHLEVSKVMAVPHGRTYEEYIYCVTKMSLISRVKCLGIYRKVEDDFRVKRSAVVRDIVQVCDWHNTQIHLLGVVPDLHDLHDNYVKRKVRGVDSTKFVRWGLNTINVLPAHNYWPEDNREQDYFDWDAPSNPNSPGITCAQANMTEWDKYVRS